MKKTIIAYGSLSLSKSDEYIKLNCLYYKNSKDLYIENSNANVIYGVCIELFNQILNNDLYFTADKLTQNCINKLNNYKYSECIQLINKNINNNKKTYQEYKRLLEMAKSSNLPFVQSWGKLS